MRSNVTARQFPRKNVETQLGSGLGTGSKTCRQRGSLPEGKRHLTLIIWFYFLMRPASIKELISLNFWRLLSHTSTSQLEVCEQRRRLKLTSLFSLYTKLWHFLFISWRCYVVFGTCKLSAQEIVKLAVVLCNVSSSFLSCRVYSVLWRSCFKNVSSLSFVTYSPVAPWWTIGHWQVLPSAILSNACQLTVNSF